MLPPLAATYQGHSDIVNGKFPGDIGVGNSSARKFTYFENVHLSNFRAPIAFPFVVKTILQSMNSVLVTGAPFKVLNSIIRLFTILVIHLRESAIIGYICQCNQSMNRKPFLDTTNIIESDFFVPITIRTISEHFSILAASPFRETKNLPIFRNRISVPETRNLFHYQIIPQIL